MRTLVAVVCVVALALTGCARQPGRPGRPPAPTPTPAAKANGPRFLVHPGKDDGQVEVRDVGNANLVAQARVTAGEKVEQVAVAGDDTTFIISTSDETTRGRATFWRLRLAADGKVAEFTALTHLTVGNLGLEADMTVSPDGGKIAYVRYRGHPDQKRIPIENAMMRIGDIEIISVATGKRRLWSSPHMSKISSLSWAGSTLAFVYTRLEAPHQGLGVGTVSTEFRTLDTAAAGDELLAGKPLLRRVHEGVGAVLLSRDGRTFVAEQGTGPKATLGVYSATTGRRIRDLKAPALSGWRSLTADATGRHLLAVPVEGNPVHIDPAGRIVTLPHTTFSAGVVAW